MNKIEKIKQAILDAENSISKSAHFTYDVPALTSLKLRHLANNLGALGTNYLECGPHKGGIFCAIIRGNDNLKTIVAIDSFESDMDAVEKAEPIFFANVIEHKPEKTTFMLLVGDCFEINLKSIPNPIDLYTYDAGHSEDDQRKALTYYLPVLADEFIFLVDDYDWPEVRKGTQDGIKECNLEVLFEHTLVGNDHDNDGYWNGFYIALLKKSK